MSWQFDTFYIGDLTLGQAHKWYMKTPPFLRSISQCIETEKEFIDELSGSINFSGIIDNRLKGVVHGEEKSKTVIEGHLFCSADVDLDFVTALVTYSKIETLKKYQAVVTMISTRHRCFRKLGCSVY